MTNKELRKEYPFLISRNRWTDEIVEIDEDWDFTELDYLPNGWRKAFGEKMCKELKEILIKGKCLNDYRIMDIKEKWGFLHWYSNGIPKLVFDEYIEWERKYEELSKRTCIKCGKPATHITTWWVSPYCTECAKEIAKHEHVEKINSDNWYFDLEENNG